MATLQDIKKRIVSIKNTQKITKAMKMVAAAKLRRAQQALNNHRPYANKLDELINHIIAQSDPQDKHILTQAHDQNTNNELLVYTSNRGLCGGFNGNLLRKTEQFINDIKEQNNNFNLNMIGKKGSSFFKIRNVAITNFYPELADEFSFNKALDLADKAINQFLNSKTDNYYIIYNAFVTTATHKVTIKKLLPISLDESLITKQDNDSSQFDFIYEPQKPELLTALLHRYVAIQIYRAHLESYTAELGARMVAMENATQNANDMVGYLTLQYNRARQAAITTELMDIVNGAEALK